jgi:predicted negative regulator of RcsB-dependent stress response
MSSSHLSRKDLKKDPLAMEVEQGVEYVATHKSQVTLYVGVAVLVLLAVAGFLFYRNRQASAREEAFAKARLVMGATVGAPSPGSVMNFPTQDDKDKAQATAFTKVADDYPGSTEGSIARMYVAASKMDKGDLDGAISDYRQVMDKGPSDLASSAKLAVAQLLWGQGKPDEGKKLLQDLIDHPTTFVSSEQAKLTLARLQSDSNPTEAKKLLDSLDKASPAVKMFATDLAAQLPK